MLTDDEAQEATRNFQASIDRLFIDVAAALHPWAKTTQNALIAAFAPIFEQLRDDCPEAFDDDGNLRDDWLEIVRRAKNDQ
jgi:hypothetical protein